MFYSESKSEFSEMAYKIDGNIKDNLEYYYHANLILDVFAIGAFVLYILTGISRGIFLLLDLFLIYKAVKGFFRANRLKKTLMGTGEHLKLVKGIIIFNIFLLMEAITRHFLEMNINIIGYFWIMALIYCSTMVVYKLIKAYNKKRIYKAISIGNYNNVISLKKTKEKIFTVLSLFLILVLVIVRLMGVFKGEEFIALMTFIYISILLFNIDIGTEVSVEYDLIVKGKLKNINIDSTRAEVYEEEDSFEEGDTLSGFEAITDEQIERYNNKEKNLYSNDYNKDDLDKTEAMDFSKNTFNEEPIIQSRAERRREAKNKKFKFLKEMDLEGHLGKIKDKVKRKK